MSKQRSVDGRRRRLILAGLACPLLVATIYSAVVQAAGEMKFSGTLTSQPPCTVTPGMDMYADFGQTVMSDKVDGVKYMQKVIYGFTCTGNSANTLKFQLYGLGTDFDPKAVKTTNPNLGIAIYNGNTRIGVNEWINFTYPNIPELKMVPVKRPSVKLQSSGIVGNVVLYIDYQ